MRRWNVGWTGGTAGLGEVLGLAVVGLVVSGTSLSAQGQEALQNLQYYPEAITRPELVNEMRGISLSLGVRCQFCHVGSVDGVSFEGVDFASDESPNKVAAREMLRLVDRINRTVQNDLPDQGVRTEVTCKTCHRGASRPQLLWQRLREALETGGPSSLPEAYAQARQALEGGRYDFGTWELNLWAESLAAEDRPADAAAVLELNLEHHEGDPGILGILAPVYERLDRRDDAIAAYEAILAVQPQNARARDRLDALRGRLEPGGA